MLALLPLELKTKSPLTGLPWANWLLITANVAFFLVCWLPGWQWTCGRGTSIFSVLLYGFSHAGFWHLAGNMWCLVVFGDAVNKRIGNRNYLLAYVGSIVAIGIIAWLMMPGGVIGASGGVFTVIGIALLLLPAAKLRLAYLVVFPLTLIAALLRKPEHPWQWAIRWGDLLVPMLWCLLLVPLLEIMNFWLSGWSWTHLGHLLGLVFGVVAVLLMPTTITLRRPIPAV